MNNVQPDVRAIFCAALDRQSAAEVARFLDLACGDDAEIRAQVEALLDSHRQAVKFLGGTGSGEPVTIDRPVTERVGATVGRYKLLEQVGEGGMGIVFVAEQTEPVRRRVALKIIKPGMDTKQVIARFEAERQALAMMDHPNIARILDAGVVGEGARGQGPGAREVEEGLRGEAPTSLVPDPWSLTPTAARPYFVMELVRGMPITEYCDKARLGPHQRLALFVDVCQAVQHAHQKGIIHRDLKPSNVMITLHDGNPVVKVIDFGVAKAVGQQLTERTIYTALTQLVGTPLYMSPEQAEMSGLDVDTRSDVYSLGVLLYELLTGQTPFDRETLAKAGLDEIRRIIREDEPLRPSRRFSTLGAQASFTISQHRGLDERRLSKMLSGELDWIVMKALEKDRSRRYESASSLAADVQRYLTDEPVHACPPTTMYRFQKFARKHKPALVTTFAIAVSLILGTTASAWQAARATQAEAQAIANANQAQEKAQEATSQRDEAQRQRDEVKTLNEKLAAKEQQLQKALYAAHINLAQHAWDASNPERMKELLVQHRPKPGQTDVRGFEWHYLYRLCHSDLLTLKGHSNSVRSLAYSPDGKRLASSARGPELTVWDAQTGQELWTFRPARIISSVGFAADGKRLAGAAGRDGVKVWDAQTGQELLALKHASGGSTSVTFSPDGKRLASGGYKNLEGDKWETEVKVWDAQTSQELLTFNGPPESLISLAFSPDSKRLAGAFHEEIVRVWDAQTGELLFSLKGYVSSVAFSPDNALLATAAGRDVKLWDAQTGQLVRSLNGEAVHLAISPDGKRLASSSWLRGGLDIWDLESGNVIRTLKGRFGILAFSPDGNGLASSADDFTIKVWDTQNDQEGRSLKTGDTIALSHDWRRVAGVSADNTLKISDVETGQPTVTPKGHSVRVRMMAFSPDGKRLASGAGGRIGGSGIGSNDQAEVKVWDAQTGQEQFTIAGLAGNIFGLAFSPDGKRLVTASQNPADATTVALRVWDAQSGAELLSIKGHTGPIWSAVFSRDGERLVSAGRDVKVWDATSGHEVHRFEGQAGWFESLAYSSDGKRLASGRSDGIVKVWDAQSRQELISFKGHTATVTSVTFSSDGTRLATLALDNKAKVWDAQTGQELLTLEATSGRFRGRFNRVIFRPDGYRLAINGPNGTVKIYDATPLPAMP